MMTMSSFVVAWCLHPSFVPDEKIIFISKPNVRIPGNALYIGVEEVVLNRLLGLCYLVHLRIVEYQDWSTPSPSSIDEGLDMDDDDMDDSDNNNFNGVHPGLDGN
jgi:hypothetical protein